MGGASPNLRIGQAWMASSRCTRSDLSTVGVRPSNPHNNQLALACVETVGESCALSFANFPSAVFGSSFRTMEERIGLSTSMHHRTILAWSVQSGKGHDLCTRELCNVSPQPARHTCHRRIGPRREGRWRRAFSGLRPSLMDRGPSLHPSSITHQRCVCLAKMHAHIPSALRLDSACWEGCGLDWERWAPRDTTYSELGVSLSWPR